MWWLRRTITVAVPKIRARAMARSIAFTVSQGPGSLLPSQVTAAGNSATTFGSRRLSNEGVLRAFTIVQRGAKSGPFTSAVVELNGGGVVKANLLGVTDPAQIHPELKVRLATFPAGTDDDGTVAVAFGYEPVGA